MAQQLVREAERLRDAVDELSFEPPVTHVYNPLRYAWAPHREYLRRYGGGRKRVLFLGMNPGPFGMAQTGVPFGEVSAVRDWMEIREPVARPDPEHERRPIEGFDCLRSEVSGRRLWGLFRLRFGSAAAFFAEHFVVNYCPLVFMEASGCNRTPDKLSAEEREPLQAICDVHLAAVVALLKPEWVIGVGRFGEQRARLVCSDGTAKIGAMLHPSPASPASNRDWEGIAAGQLARLGVWK